MIIKTINQLLKENIDKKLSAKNDNSYYHVIQNSRSGEDNTQIMYIDSLKLKQLCDGGLSNLKILHKRTIRIETV